jgi:hypothetical protein
MPPTARSLRFWFALCVFLAVVPFAVPSRAAEAPSPQTSIERLTRVAKLWGKVRYLHPYLAYREDLDWDAALVAALPKIRAAGTTEEYRAAVSGLLSALGDPATRVLPADKPAGEKPPAVELFRELEGGALGIDLGRRIASAGGVDAYRQIGRELPRVAAATEVVLDLRTGLPTGDSTKEGSWVLSEMAGAIASRPCRGPAERYLLHSGYVGTNVTSGGYYSGFLEQLATVFRPEPELHPAAKKVAFVVDRRTPVPAIAFALQACGDGRIVAVGGLPEESGGSTIDVDLGEQVTARMRVSEQLPFGSTLAADAVVPEAEAERATAAAIAALRVERRAGTEPPRALPGGVFRSDPAYPEMTEPDLPIASSR